MSSIKWFVTKIKEVTKVKFCLQANIWKWTSCYICQFLHKNGWAQEIHEVDMDEKDLMDQLWSGIGKCSMKFIFKSCFPGKNWIYAFISDTERYFLFALEFDTKLHGSKLVIMKIWMISWVLICFFFLSDCLFSFLFKGHESVPQFKIQFFWQRRTDRFLILVSHLFKMLSFLIF